MWRWDGDSHTVSKPDTVTESHAVSQSGTHLQSNSFTKSVTGAADSNADNACANDSSAHVKLHSHADPNSNSFDHVVTWRFTHGYPDTNDRWEPNAHIKR